MEFSMQPSIPFNKPLIAGRELDYVTEAIRLGKISSDGRYTRDCAGFLEDRFGIEKVLMTPSCTAALELAVMLCDMGPDDEVILPSYTFVSTANAVLRQGGKPVFVDIRPDTLCIDEKLIQTAITSKTKAIMPMHYAGVGCEMDTIMRLADEHNLMVIEDAAQAVNAFYRDRPLGSIGHLGTYSFHDTKNVVCGEGGALCVNRPELIERAEILRQKGTNRSQFMRGEVDKYTWVDVGSSYVPSEICCAFLLAQLEAVDTITRRRQEIFDFYYEQFGPLQEQGLLRRPIVPAHCRANGHIFYILLPDEQTRDNLMAHLKQQGIRAVFHYVPLHNAPMGKRFGYSTGDLPITEELSGRVLRLPFYTDITREAQMRVVQQALYFFQQSQMEVS